MAASALRKAALALSTVGVIAAAACGAPPAGPTGAGQGGGEHAQHGGQGGGMQDGMQDGAAGGHHHDSEETGSGLTDVQGGYRLAEVTAPMSPGRPGTLSFRILGPNGAAQTRYQPEQTQLLHGYVVRGDLTDFDHVHPQMAPDGRWSAPLLLERPGPYRVVTEFIALDDAGAPHHRVLAADVEVPGPYTAAALPAPSGQAAADGYVVSVAPQTQPDGTTRLALRFDRNGAPVTDLEPYLETYAHLTGFHEDDLEAVHFHPSAQPVPGRTGGPALDAAAEFPSPGNYRLFIQFQTAGTVHTAPLTLTAP